jgi:hypothetical protein
MTLTKRLEKLEKIVNNLPSATAQSQALARREGHESLAEFEAEIRTVKMKAEAENNLPIVLLCIDKLQKLANLEGGSTEKELCEVDDETATRLAMTHLERKGLLRKQVLVNAPSITEQQEKPEADPVSQSSTPPNEVVLPEPDRDRTYARKYEAARQLPESWLHAKW